MNGAMHLGFLDFTTPQYSISDSAEFCPLLPSKHYVEIRRITKQTPGEDLDNNKLGVLTHH
jgi:aminoglycoside phosphotransferase family enzyme